MNERCSRFRRRPLALIAGLLFSVSVMAQSPQSIDIPPQRLDKALNALAQQAGVQIAFSSAAAEAHSAPGVKGSLSPKEALRRLLAGSGLKLQEQGDGIYVVVAESEGTSSASEHGAKTMDAILVVGSLDDQVAIGSKAGQTLRETPKSVTLVTRERLEAQNLSSLEDAMKQTTGITVAGYGSGESWYFSRGIRVQTILKDGGAAGFTGDFGSYLTPDMSSYQQVEVLRGVDGMFTGAGEPGGVINLVRKRAQAKPAVQLNLSAGRWDFYRGEVDVTGALTKDKRLRGRLVAAAQNNGYFYERAESDRKNYFGTVEYDVTPTTLLVVGASHERRKEDAYSPQGTGRYTDGTPLNIPRHFAYNPDWSHWYFTTDESFLRLDQQYGETGTLKLNLTRVEQSSQSRTLSPYGEVDRDTMQGMFGAGWANDNQSVQTLLDLSANGRFHLFGGEHRYTVGADYAKIDGGGSKGYTLDTYAWGVNNGRPIDVWNFDPSLYPRPTETLSRYMPERKQTQNGFYGTVTLELASPLKLTLGGRYGEYSYLNVNQAVAPDGTYGAPVLSRYKDSAFIPSAALTWDFARDWTAYASLAETFKVQANLLQAPLPGTPLDPVTGRSMEVGVKGEILGFLNTAVAAFRLERSGQGARDPQYPTTPGEAGAICCYVRQQDMTTKGVDIEMSGMVLPGWQVFGGYTYSTTEYANNAAWAYYIHMTPRHMVKLWTTWQLPGSLSRWTLNGGVMAQSDTYTVPYPTADSQYAYGYRFAQSGYAVWNAAVKYRVNDQWDVGLYADNLFDKNYYQALGLGGRTETVFGTPRSFVLSVRGRW